MKLENEKNKEPRNDDNKTKAAGKGVEGFCFKLLYG